ncbi:protein gp37 [Sphingomonas sp. YR710]|uniref:phage Gp37/Gp68 family protein n=1 Tax=Sphingomonas sp. YR710 TaxID=1882773 RepID=UPI00088F4ECC|nr:phage Gp37/Gp68 family protein [Sphingomonas sp. YR710]SDC30295.1 protein gp37 [Sphingomonas sp. YR710]
MTGSKIEWTGETWNPIVGCSLESPGCKLCYAMRDAYRKQFHPNAKIAAKYEGVATNVNGHIVWTGRLNFSEDALSIPLRKRKPTTWFVNSMSDLFHPDVTDEQIDRVFAVMTMTPHHTYQVLTKRSERMRDYLTTFEDRPEQFGEALAKIVLAAGLARDEGIAALDAMHWPLPNVWLGVSVEDQRRADERIPNLLATPAAVRFLSMEPLLGPVDLNSSLGGTRWIGGQRGCAGSPERNGAMHHGTGAPDCPRHLHHHHDDRCQPGLDWIIVGGESGPGARPMHPDWARKIRDDCSAANVPMFFKQWGEWEPRDEWSPDLRLPMVAIKVDGSQVPHDVAPQDVGGCRMARVGKKAAGRLLDSVQHDGMPG